MCEKAKQMCVTSVRACMREWVRGVCREADERCRGERDAAGGVASVQMSVCASAESARGGGPA